MRRTSARKKMLLGILAAVPAVYAIIFVVFIMPIALKTVRDPSDANPESIRTWFTALVLVHVAVMVAGLLLVIGFLLHLYRSRLDPGRKTIWALGLVFGNVFVLPFYYYSNMGRNDDEDQAGERE